MLEGCTPYPADDSARYVREGYWRPETLGELLETAARAWPQRTVVADGARRVRYAELDTLTNRLALHLLEGWNLIDSVYFSVITLAT